MKYKYIVVAPSYSENSGGTIFLHELVNALNIRGEAAALSPMEPVYKPSRRQRLKNLLVPQPFLCDPALNTPVAEPENLGPDSIVVYPELVFGNPLGARHVVRWLLYTPGIQHPYAFGAEDMFFRVDAFADLPDVTGGATDMFLWKVNRAYRNEHNPDRAGACFMVRKWGDGPRHVVTDGAQQVDGKPHEELNEIFNRCEVFYTYDDATMYSHYAAVCGCLSVVIPSGDTARTDVLMNQPLNKYGIAYGLEETQIAHARETQHKVLDLLLAREAEGLKSVENFIALTQARFTVS